jgi:leader peptidase (prepilin peptidase)/N-methyltransferase
MMTPCFSLFGLVVFTFGACIGSFLNVCIYRIPEKLSIVLPGSFCPNCNTPLPFYCNIPIFSYLALAGKCKFCKHPISLRYPLVEMLTGIFALFVFCRFGPTPAAGFWFAFISVLIVISLIDMDHQIIPDILSLPGILIFASSFVFLPEMRFTDTLLGILAGGGSLYVVALMYYALRKQEGMGGGDIKLLAMIGAATGIKGVLFTVFAGSVLGTLAGLFIMAYMKTRASGLKIPFGPFLSFGAIVYIFFGSRLIQWYMMMLTP